MHSRESTEAYEDGFGFSGAVFQFEVAFLNLVTIQLSTQMLIQKATHLS